MFDLQLFSRALSAMLPAALSEKMERPHLSGVVIKMISAGEDIPRQGPAKVDTYVAVSTDGHRLHIGAIPHIGPSVECRIPTDTAKEIIKWARSRRKVPGIVLTLTDTSVALSDGTAIAFKEACPHGEFPPYRLVIPAYRPEKHARFGVSGTYLAQAMEAAEGYNIGDKGGVFVESGADPLDPIVVFPGSPDAYFLAVVVPMRL